MDKRNLYYIYWENKRKINIIGAIILFLIVLFLAYSIFKNKNDIYKTFDKVASEKYVLAEKIIGANSDGKVNLYDVEKEKIIDTVDLNGNFIYDESDNLKSLSALNTKTGELYKINYKGNKINKSVEQINLNKKQIISFDYDNGKFVGLDKNNKTFIIKDVKSDKVKNYSPSINGKSIDIFKIVDNSLIFTSGDYIYSKKIDDNSKELSINIGASSEYIHELKDKILIHNNFASDRKKSILLDINPETLYINKMSIFDEYKANTVKSNILDYRLYYSNIIEGSSEKIRQIVMQKDFDKNKDTLAFKYTSNDAFDINNSYGSMGYIYLRENDKIKVFGLKTRANEYTIKLNDDFYMPIY